jgi:hypothetical protein
VTPKQKRWPASRSRSVQPVIWRLPRRELREVPVVKCPKAKRDIPTKPLDVRVSKSIEQVSVVRLLLLTSRQTQAARLTLALAWLRPLTRRRPLATWLTAKVQGCVFPQLARPRAEPRLRPGLIAAELVRHSSSSWQAQAQSGSLQRSWLLPAHAWLILSPATSGTTFCPPQRHSDTTTSSTLPRTIRRYMRVRAIKRMATPTPFQRSIDRSRAFTFQ